MVRLLFYLALFAVIYFLIKGLVRGLSSARPRGRKPLSDVMVQCPQCKVYLPQSMALYRRVEGARQAFCSEECARAFKEDRL